MIVGIFAASRVGGDYDLKSIFGGNAPRRLDRVSEMAVAASGLAFQAAQKAGHVMPADPEKSGVFYATGQGNFSGTIAFLEKMRDKGARFANPIDFPNLVMSAGAGTLSMQFQLKGELLTLTQQGFAGLQALCFAHESLDAGRLECALAAGAEEMSAPRSRCADLLGKKNLGEGAAAIVLARVAHAPVRVRNVAMAGPSVDRDALVKKVLAGSLHETADIVEAPGRGELDVAGLLDAAHAAHLIASGDLSHAVCISHGMEGGCAVLLERGQA